jgi:hypothetical protein
MNIPSGRISNEPEEEEEREREKKMPFIVATYVYASSQGQRMHSARTKIRNNMVQLFYSLTILHKYLKPEISLD